MVIYVEDHTIYKPTRVEKSKMASKATIGKIEEESINNILESLASLVFRLPIIRVNLPDAIDIRQLKLELEYAFLVNFPGGMVIDSPNLVIEYYQGQNIILRRK